MNIFEKKIAEALTVKVLGQGAEITTEQLAEINKLTKVSLRSEEVFARKMVLAHNAIDRDDERFSETLLDDFASTLPGKSLLIGHRQGPPGVGIFFSAEIKELSLDEGKALTGEDLVLPEGINKFKYLEAWFYIPITPEKENLLKDIDAGVVSHTSIGFGAAARVRVHDEETDTTLYCEYKSPGEAREGSLVYLGAQPGATIIKAAKAPDVDIEAKGKTNKTKEDKKAMKSIFKVLGVSETEDISEALQKISDLKQSATRLKAFEPVLEALGEDNSTVEQVKVLLANACDGKAFREDLVEKYLKGERLLERFDDTDEAKAVRKKQLEKREIKELKDELVHLDALVIEKHPGKSVLGGGELQERSDKGAGGTADEFDFEIKKD